LVNEQAEKCLFVRPVVTGSTAYTSIDRKCGVCHYQSLRSAGRLMNGSKLRCINGAAHSCTIFHPHVYSYTYTNVGPPTIYNALTCSYWTDFCKFGRQNSSVWDEAIPFHTSAKKHVEKLGESGGSERQKQYRSKNLFNW
jgi:hypothetical protein